MVEIENSFHKTKRHHMIGPSSHVNLDNNSSLCDLVNLIMNEDFRSGILKECTNTRSAMERAGRKGDWDRTKYPDSTTFSREEIDSYLGMLLANDIKMKPQINLWFL